MTTPAVRLVLPPLHPIQQTVFDDPTRFKVLVAGRRVGKSRLAASTVLCGLLRGENWWWVSPSFDISKRVGWKMIERALRPLLRAGYGEANKSDLRITLANGGEFQAKSADDPSHLVGEGLDGVVVDEAGIVSEIAWTESIRAALSDRKGHGLLIGTPKGRNWFYAAYQRGQDPTQDEWHSWQYPTAANPFIDPLEIDAARQELPDLIFRQEYLAEFLEDSGTVFRNLDKCLDRVPYTVGETVMGIDWGRSNDFTVLTVLDVETRRVVEVDRFNQINWETQRSRVETLAKRWQPKLILAEENSIGSPNIEALQSLDLPVQAFTTTANSKAQIINQLALAFEQETIKLMDNPMLLNELRAYEMERLPSGNWRYSAPDGVHDDMVMSLALALEAVQTSQVQVFFF